MWRRSWSSAGILFATSVSRSTKPKAGKFSSAKKRWVIVVSVPQLWEWTDGVQAPTQVCKADMSSDEQEEYLGRFAAAPWRTVYPAARKKIEDGRFAGGMERA